MVTLISIERPSLPPVSESLSTRNPATAQRGPRTPVTGGTSDRPLTRIDATRYGCLIPVLNVSPTPFLGSQPKARCRLRPPMISSLPPYKTSPTHYAIPPQARHYRPSLTVMSKPSANSPTSSLVLSRPPRMQPNQRRHQRPHHHPRLGSLRCLRPLPHL
jgi:hypothetical protein